MWIDPDWRGLGLGGWLLAHLEAVGRNLGYARVVLDTIGTLVEAIAMYQRAGFRPIEPYNTNPLQLSVLWLRAHAAPFSGFSPG